MATTTILPRSNYPSGSRTIGPVAIADNLSKVILQIARSTTADTAIWQSASTTVDLKAYVSINGGPLTFVSGITVAGGILTKRDGTEVTRSTFEVLLPAGINRQLSLDAVIVDGPLRTVVEVVTE